VSEGDFLKMAITD